jgi:hypothetical protein
MVKQMNSVHPSESRISLTTESLNFTLPIQHSIAKMEINHSKGDAKKVQGTLADVNRLEHEIASKIGETTANLHTIKTFNGTLWWNTTPNQAPLTPCSDRAEAAYSDVCEWVMRNKTMLVESDGAETVEVGSDDAESDHAEVDEDVSDWEMY